MLWSHWWKLVLELRGACSRTRTFLWMAVVLAGMTVRKDMAGVTSVMRSLGLAANCYGRLLDFFHSDALDIERLTTRFRELVFAVHPGILRINGRVVAVVDGLKVAKSGRKMPGVKQLHQSSGSNTKPEFIRGHSCQAIAILTRCLSTVVALPLIARIHEGVVFSNFDQSTLLDRALTLLESLRLPGPLYLVADAYYAAGKIVRGLLERGDHLVTRVKSNAVAWFPAPPPDPDAPKKRGRKPKYGAKVNVRSLLDGTFPVCRAKSPVYGEKDVEIEFVVADLLWRVAGVLVRFVAVRHPHRGSILLMSSDLSLTPLQIIEIYGMRFKIELSFKQSLRTIGAYVYHFWMLKMDPLKRRGGDQYLHRKPRPYRDAVRRKLAAYHRHIQLGIVAHGLLDILAALHPSLVFSSFGSWLRTIRPGVAPSELVTATALGNSLPEFLADGRQSSIFKNFLRDNLDLDRAEGTRLVA